MPRLSATHLLSLASLLVAMILGGCPVPIPVPFTLAACTEGVWALQVTPIGSGGTGGAG